VDADQQPAGLLKAQQLKFGGYTDQQVDDWKSATAQKLQQGGYSADQINQYFGRKEPDMSGFKSKVADNLKKNGYVPPTGPIEAKGLIEAAKAGWEQGNVGMFVGGKPDTVLGPDAGYGQHFVASAAQMLGDFPTMLAAGGAAFETGPIGMAAAAFAAPPAIRSLLTDEYNKPGGIDSAGEMASRITKATIEAMKGATVGVASELTGGLGGALAGTAGRVAAEIAAQTTVSSALEGHLPSKNDFINGAIAIGGLHAVGYITPKLMNIYKNTGALPHETIEAASNDPALKGELLSENQDIPKDAKGSEPPPPSEDQTKSEDGSNVPATIPKEEDTKPGASAARDEILSRIGEKKEPAKKSLVDTVSDGIDSAVANGLDYTTAVKDQIEALGDKLDNPENAHVLMRIFAAVNDKVAQFLDVGTRDFNTAEVNGESLMDIFQEYKQKTGDILLNNFKAFGIAARTLELGLRGKDQPGTENRSDAQSADREFLRNNPQVAPFFQRFVDFGNRVIDYVAASGRYSQESAEAIKDLNQRHISFKKIIEPDPITGLTPSGSRAIKKIGDSDLKLQDPILSRLKDLKALIELAHITKAHNTYISDMLGEDLQQHLQEPVPGQALLGGEVEETDTQKPDALIRRSKNQTGPMDPKTQVAYWDNGKRTLFDVPKEVAASLNRMVGNDPAISTWTSLLKPFATALRIGTVDNPLFAPRHAWRQELTAPTLSQTGLKMFQAFSYLPEFLKGGDKVQNFFYDGGAVSSLKPLAENYLDNKIYELNKDAPFTDKAWNLAKRVGDFSHMLIVSHDNMIRFAEYSRMLDKGASRVEAAFAAREVLPDFQKQGLQRSALLQITAFLNVHLQGQSRMFQALGQDAKVMQGYLKGDVAPLDALKQLGTGYIAKNLAYITVPSVLLSLAQSNDDALKDSPNWQKYNYWQIHMANWRPANSLAEAMSVKSAYPSNYRLMPDGTHQVNDGTIYRIQKPFTNGILFGSGIEAAMEAFQKKDPGAFGSFVKTVGRSLIPDALPTAVQPLVEQAVNRQMYTNTALVRQSMENKLPEMQYDRYTSETAKALGKVLSYVPLVRDIGPSDAKLDSPQVLENYIRGWSGTLGYYAVNVIDKGLRAAGIAPDVVKPVDTLSDIPFVKEFTIRFPNAKPQSISDFEDRYKQASQVQASIKAMAQQGNIVEARRLMDKYSINMDKLVGIDKAIQNTNMAIQKVYQDPGINPVQKRQLIDTMMYHMVSAAKFGNAQMDEFSEMAKAKKTAGQ
jgi:hypothetical protein